jgi:hypothetical protein
MYSELDTLSRHLETCCAEPPNPDMPGSLCPHAVATLRVAALRTARRISADGLEACMGSPMQAINLSRTDFLDV